MTRLQGTVLLQSRETVFLKFKKVGAMFFSLELFIRGGGGGTRNGVRGGLVRGRGGVGGKCPRGGGGRGGGGG